jgi:uncharacterized membrane protein YkoI
MLKFKFLLAALFILLAIAAFWTMANTGEKAPFTSFEDRPASKVPAKVIESANKAVSGGELEEVVKEDKEKGEHEEKDNDTEKDDDDEGKDDDSDKDEKAPLSEVPAKVLESVNKAVPGGEIKEVEKEVEDGAVIYEIKKVVDGVEYEIEVTEDGVVKKIEKEGNVRIWNFNADVLEKTAVGFSIAETGGEGKLATWQVIEDKSAPSPSNVFALTKNENYGSTFNLVIAEDTSYKNLDISVKVKAVSGKEDQGGGPIWRAKDADNYYIARWNPLENNFRVYFVKDGRRKQLGNANVKVPSDQWHTIRIVMIGQKIDAYLNGEKLITVEDSTFAAAGMVGLWTKADAATSFDDLSVIPIR